jgi:hypothetical protein
MGKEPSIYLSFLYLKEIFILLSHTTPPLHKWIDARILSPLTIFLFPSQLHKLPAAVVGQAGGQAG